MFTRGRRFGSHSSKNKAFEFNTCSVNKNDASDQKYSCQFVKVYGKKVVRLNSNGVATEKVKAMTLGSLSIQLADNVHLKNLNSKWYLTSDAPLRYIRVPHSVSRFIDRLSAHGCRMSDVYANMGKSASKQLTQTLFALIQKGYLRLHQNDIMSGEEDLPTVSVIIPVKNRPDDIVECLTALSSVDYPENKLEIIVVDDGSNDNTSARVRDFNVRLIPQSVSRGPAASRNTGAKKATGDILAFLDSDCVADRAWLKQLVPLFFVEGIGAVGGLVNSYFKTTRLDRYEAAFSSLSMGNRILFGSTSESNFYVPTCNMLIRRDVFETAGGFSDGMHVGEDVDLCWRMRKKGHFLLYVPFGPVSHKHRNQLGKMLKRKAEYGTSEAELYKYHPDKKKQFIAPARSSLSFIAFIAAIFFNIPVLAALCMILYGLDVLHKKARLKKLDSDIERDITFRKLCLSTLKSHFSLFYYAGFFMIRYFLIVFILAGMVNYSAWIVGFILLGICSGVDFRIRKPKLTYPVFLVIYVLEHCAYQIGVFIGCVRHKYMKCYLPLIRINRQLSW